MTGSFTSTFRNDNVNDSNSSKLAHFGIWQDLILLFNIPTIFDVQITQYDFILKDGSTKDLYICKVS